MTQRHRPPKHIRLAPKFADLPVGAEVFDDRGRPVGKVVEQTEDRTFIHLANDRAPTYFKEPFRHWNCVSLKHNGVHIKTFVDPY